MPSIPVKKPTPRIMKILILCTGNTCRSQMAEGYLRSLDPSLELYSAGTEPGEQVHPLAVKVMQEKGIDINDGVPKTVEKFIDDSFDYVITVCDEAREMCPVFTGEVKHCIHIGFDDPAGATGTDAEVLAVFRRVRDEIFRDFSDFYQQKIARR